MGPLLQPKQAKVRHNPRLYPESFAFSVHLVVDSRVKIKYFLLIWKFFYVKYLHTSAFGVSCTRTCSTK